jgi:sec-independent protein translocase protein TatA
MTGADATVAQFISMPGGGEWLIIAFIGLLLFGKRLPEVGRSLGRGIVEFKKGLRGIEDHIEEAVNRPSSSEPSESPAASDPELPHYENYEAQEPTATTEEQPAEKVEAHPGP